MPTTDHEVQDVENGLERRMDEKFTVPRFLVVLIRNFSGDKHIPLLTSAPEGVSPVRLGGRAQDGCAEVFLRSSLSCSGRDRQVHAFSPHHHLHIPAIWGRPFISHNEAGTMESLLLVYYIQGLMIIVPDSFPVCSIRPLHLSSPPSFPFPSLSVIALTSSA